jgi:hypothetical protein
MKKTEAIKIFLRSPFQILKRGLQGYSNEYYRGEVKKKYDLERLPTIDVLEIFPNIQEELNYFSFQPGTSGILDHLVLKQFAQIFNDCQYLEIGSLRGESLANVAEVAKNCVGVSLGPNQMRQRGYSQDLINVLNFYSNGILNVKHIEADSTTFNFKTLNQKFDLIFVDGDHRYHGVLNDTQKVLPLRKDENSIVVWHDYSDSTEDVSYEVFNGILDGISADKHKNLYHISNTLCAVYIENNELPTFSLKSYKKPNKNFKVSLSGKFQSK